MSNQNPILNAVVHAVQLKVSGSIHVEYLEVQPTKANIKKIKLVAEALKYAGLHLLIEYKDWESYKHIRIWTESNTEENHRSEYTLIGFANGLDSAA